MILDYFSDPIPLILLLHSLFLVNVQAEAPNGHLYGFEGFLESRMNNQTTTTTQQSEKFPLTVNQLLLRGSTLRNSGHIYGLVVYTGEESKIRMNANSKPRTKAPAMERTTNKIIVVLFSLILLFASISTGASFAWRTTFSSAWYLNLPFDGVR